MSSTSSGFSRDSVVNALRSVYFEVMEASCQAQRDAEQKAFHKSQAARSLAWQEYEQVVNQAKEAHDAFCVPAQRDFDLVRKPAHEILAEDIESARRTFKAALKEVEGHFVARHKETTRIRELYVKQHEEVYQVTLQSLNEGDDALKTAARKDLDAAEAQARESCQSGYQAASNACDEEVKAIAGIRDQAIQVAQGRYDAATQSAKEVYESIVLPARQAQIATLKKAWAIKDTRDREAASEYEAAKLAAKERFELERKGRVESWLWCLAALDQLCEMGEETLRRVDEVRELDGTGRQDQQVADLLKP